MALHLSVWECPSKAVRDRPCGYYPGHSNAMCAGGMGRARELSFGRGPLQSCARARLEWEPRSWDEQKPTRAPECNLTPQHALLCAEYPLTTRCRLRADSVELNGLVSCCLFRTASGTVGRTTGERVLMAVKKELESPCSLLESGSLLSLAGEMVILG